MLGNQILILFFLLIFSGFFSGVETALMSVNMIKVRSLMRQKRRGSEALYRLKQNPHSLIITILIGNNLVNIAAASLATLIFTGLFGSSGLGIATGVMTFLILVFGEITPKTLATQHAESISLVVARPIELLSHALSPFVKFFEIISRFVSRLFGAKEKEEISEEELRTIVTMGVREGILNREAAKMIHNLLKFEGTKVVDIMTPKSSMSMVDGKAKLREVIGFMVKTPFSKYPVYAGDKEKIIGILDVDDVLKYVKNNRLNIQVRKISRQVYIVPESKEIDDLLSEFEGKHMPLAIVVDEYGEISGLVTVEDILEEIVGDIFDKSRRTSVYIKKVKPNMIRADGRASIEEINEVLHVGLKKEHFNTIAGFIEHKLQKVPKKGAVLKLNNVLIEVIKSTKRRIKTVRITKT